MNVTALELPARWGHPAIALADVDARLTAQAGGDLVLLPEQSLSGYVSPAGDFDLAPHAETLDGPTARACAALAQKHRTVLVAPLVLREGDALFNAMVVYGAAGVLAYRKRHPWIPEDWATPGAPPLPVVEIAGARVTIAICYDVHFLDEESPAELAAADVLLFPSAWVERPDRRIERLVALAQRHDLAIVNANWGAGIVRVPGQGGSCVIDHDGRLVGRAEPGGRVDASLFMS